tara:strand:+ start:67 stop:276 length:210 start_codon:yes stop_codon:yes gene_type:complete
MEDLDVTNVIEIENIRKILLPHPDLLSLFEILIIVCNRRINEEKTVSSMPLERSISPQLSDDSSDENDE